MSAKIWSGPFQGPRGGKYWMNWRGQKLYQNENPNAVSDGAKWQAWKMSKDAKAHIRAMAKNAVNPIHRKWAKTKIMRNGVIYDSRHDA